ncbi:hypothetical protein [Lutimonas sp.]|jgi:hypothetical protein|uniref:hypothetical protein n=1 Tax=Lutimonas sp. TaxID=1872403 RepID=UPI003C736DC9
MELAKIENLLEKYFEAETSIQEEATLQEFFAQDEVPEHLKQYKEMFNFFSNSSLETSNRSIQLTKESKRTISIKWLSIAAMLVFFIGIYSVYQQNEAEKEEARLAYMETQKALDLISQSLNKGTGAIAHLDNFNKGTDAMAQLRTFESTQKRIFNQ